MAKRILIRRDTALNWSLNNPVLYPGEIGLETDTLKMKIGPLPIAPAVATAWNSIPNYVNVVPSDLNTTLGDYLTINDLNVTVAALDGNENLLIPNDSIIFEGATADSYELTLVATDPTADRTITLPDSTGTVALTSDIPARLTVTQVNLSGTPTETYTNISTLAFDEDSGFDVTNPSSGVAKVAMNSTFKYWKVDGVQKLTATGLDTVNFISGSNIAITADGSANPQSITISATGLEELARDTIGSALTSGSGISITPNDGADTITIANTGVTSISGTTNQISASGSTGSITLSLPNAVTFPGTVTLNSDPTQALHAVTKQYVDGIAAGLNWKTAVNLLATSNIALSGNTNTLTIDGHSTLTSANDGYRILLKGQSTDSENGIYVYSDNGTTYTLARSTDADAYGELEGASVFIMEGTTYGATSWTQTNHYLTSFAGQTWSQFSGAGTYVAGNGLTLTGNSFSINTAVTVDLSSSQTLTNKTITGSFTGNLTGNADTVTNGVYTSGSYSDPSWLTISKSKVGLGNVENTALSTWAGSTNITTLGTILSGTWNASTVGTVYGGTGLTSYTTGDVLYASASNTLSKLAAGTEGYLLTMVSGVPAWAAAPISLPSQGGNSGKFLTTNGTSASWSDTPITTGTATITANTATTIDTNALSGFTSVEYMISLKQGSKIRTSKVVLQTDGTSVDMTEFAITETGGVMTGVVVSATTSGSDALLQVTVTDAATTNVTVKFSEVKL